MAQSSTRHEKMIHKANSRLDFLSKSSGALSCQSQNALSAVRRLRKQVAQSVSAVILIAADIKRIIFMLSEFSKQTLAKIAANGVGLARVCLTNTSRLCRIGFLLY